MISGTRRFDLHDFQFYFVFALTRRDNLSEKTNCLHGSWLVPHGQGQGQGRDEAAPGLGLGPSLGHEALPLSQESPSH